MKNLILGLSVAALSLNAFESRALAEEAAAPTSAGQISEVVVTAERRTQSVQTSSLAISVISPQAVKDAGVAQLRDLTKLEPGVQIGQGGPATQIYIRGVGDFGSTPTFNPAVATNIDGVYVSRSNSIEGMFFDLERIEVLKGPQGTLYGRNASGGALNILTAKPRLGVSANHIEAELGNYNLVQVEGSANIPIGDAFALRAALQVVSRDGYAAQDFDDDHHESFRLSALWRPNERFSLRVTADHTHVGGTGPGYVYKGPYSSVVAASLAANRGVAPTNPRLNYTDPRTWDVYNATVSSFCVPANAPAASARKSGTIQAGPANYCPAGTVALFAPPTTAFAKLNNRFNNFTAEADYDLGFATLTVIPAYRRVRNDYTTFPLSAYNNSAGQPEISDTYSIEARLGHTDEHLTWVAGVYGYREGQSQQQNNLGFIYFGDNLNKTKLRTDSTAVFGQATYNVAENLRVILGGRYSHDRRFIYGLNSTLDTTLSFNYVIGQVCYLKASPCVTDVFEGQRTFNSFTYKVGAEYDLTPQNMLFVTWATGQKAGGFNAFSLPGGGASSYNPEKLGALEIGARNRFLDSRLQLNLEGFYWKYKDAQEAYATINNAGAVAFGNTNAGQATMYGIDVDGIAKLTPVDTIHVGIEYLHTNFDKFVYATGGLSPQATTCAITNPPGGVGFQSVDCSGRDLIRAPKWSGTGNYTHTFELATGATIDASGSVQFASSREMGVTYTAAEHAKGYHVFDAQVTYHDADRKWSVTGFVRNINNALVYTGSFNQPAVLPSLVAANIAPPRTFGMRVAADF